MTNIPTDTPLHEALNPFVGKWELIPDFPGAENMPGHTIFEFMGTILVQRTTTPIQEAPDSFCLIVENNDASYTQHYFDERGVARLYTMTFDGQTWTLKRDSADFTPLDFAQRFVGQFSADGQVITGEWSSREPDRSWHRDFGLTYRRITDNA